MWLRLFVVALQLFADEDALARHAAAASAAMQAGDYASAESHNRALIKQAPDVPEVYTNLGLSCFLQKKYADAIEAFESGLKRKPEMANAWLFLGIARFNVNRCSQAIPALQRYTRMRPNDFQGYYFLGLSWLGLERYREAEEPLLGARQIQPSNVDVLYHLAQSYLGQARQGSAGRTALWREYEATVNQIAALDGNSYRIGQLRAGYYEATGETAKAIEELEKLLQSELKVRGLHYTLGCLYMQSRLYEKALRQFEAELRLDAPYPRTYLQLGHVYVALEKPVQALSFLEHALMIEPESGGTAWVDFGRSYNMLDQPEKAADAFEKAIQSGERTSAVYYQLAMAYRKAGKTDRFRDALKISERLRNQESQAGSTSAAPQPK